MYLNGSGGNRIDFNSNGVNPPSTATRSTGTKIVSYPNMGSGNVDYAMGIDASTLWQSVPIRSAMYKWYANTTEVARLSGNGNFNVTGTLSTPAITLNGISLQTTLSNKANTDSPNFTGVAGFDALSVGSSTQATGIVTPTISDPFGGSVLFSNGLTTTSTSTAPAITLNGTNLQTLLNSKPDSNKCSSIRL